jgi:DNA-binding MarR family transcriptional regulator
VNSTQRQAESTLLLSHNSLLIIALLQRHRRINLRHLVDLLGRTKPELEHLLEELETLGAIRRDGDRYEIATKGRRIARALELHKFDFADPERAYTAHLVGVKRKRQLKTFGLFFPKDVELS